MRAKIEMPVAFEMPRTRSTENLPPTIAAGEIGSRLRRHAEAARGVFSANTERALRGDIALFIGWCRQEGHQAMPGSLAQRNVMRRGAVVA
jgi:hypothetical protein